MVRPPGARRSRWAWTSRWRRRDVSVGAARKRTSVRRTASPAGDTSDAPEAGNEGLRELGRCCSHGRGASGRCARRRLERHRRTRPSETTESDVAGPLPAPSGPRARRTAGAKSRLICRYRSAYMVTIRLRSHWRGRNRPRSTLPLSCPQGRCRRRSGVRRPSPRGSFRRRRRHGARVHSAAATKRPPPFRRDRSRRRTVAAVDTATTAAPATSMTTTVPVVATASAPPSSRGSDTAATSPASPVQSPSTVPPPPASPPRSIAVTSPNSDVGANVLEDPLPSGMRSAEFAPSLSAAQRLADALASGDWNTARSLDPGLGTVNDEELEDGYGSLDRATLLLVDARRQGDNDELLFVLVANERAGAQTTLYCAQSTVSSTGVVQPRSATVLQRSSGTNGLADVQARRTRP